MLANQTNVRGCFFGCENSAARANEIYPSENLAKRENAHSLTRSFLPVSIWRHKTTPLLHRHEIARIHLSSREVFSEGRFGMTNIKTVKLVSKVRRLRNRCNF